MFYLTQDQELRNLTSFEQIQFSPNPEALVKSTIVGQGSLGQGTTQVPIDVQYNQASMLGVKEDIEKRFFGSRKVKVSSVLRDNMTPASLIADVRGMAQLGIAPIDRIHIGAAGVFPTRSTPESWYQARGLSKDNEATEDTPENILRKNPIFTVNVTVWINSFDGGSEPFPVVLRNAPIAYVSRLVVESNVAQMLPGRVTTDLSEEAFKKVVPADERTHYMKEEATRLNQRSRPQR